ncbi:MAG: hypothetical protein ACREXW_15335, partial [Gammaproteobacteria bacterium]
KEPERAYSIMARADIPLTDRPDIYLQSSLQAIIVSSLANRVEYACWFGAGILAAPAVTSPPTLQ